MDKVLKQQVVATIIIMYIKTMKERTSGTITHPVYKIMEYFFDQFGKDTPHAQK